MLGQKEVAQSYRSNFNSLNLCFKASLLKPVIAKTIFLFALVQIAAIFIGITLAQQQVTIVEDPSAVENSLELFAFIVLSAVALLVILYFYKGKMLFLLLELAMQFTAVHILVGLFLPGAELFAALAAVCLRVAKQEIFQQPLLLVTVAVVGALLGNSLDLLPATVLALLLSGYDVVAVFYTKHMVTLAKELTQRQAAFSIKVTHKKEKLELGTGDLVIPAMLIVSANRIGKTLFTTSGATVSIAAVLALAGAVVGIAWLFSALEKKKGYWPALPPITVASIAGIIVATLL